jgi:hypothetical protein
MLKTFQKTKPARHFTPSLTQNQYSKIKIAKFSNKTKQYCTRNLLKFLSQKAKNIEKFNSEILNLPKSDI